MRLDPRLRSLIPGQSTRLAASVGAGLTTTLVAVLMNTVSVLRGDFGFAVAWFVLSIFSASVLAVNARRFWHLTVTEALAISYTLVEAESCD